MVISRASRLGCQKPNRIKRDPLIQSSEAGKGVNAASPDQRRDTAEPETDLLPAGKRFFCCPEKIETRKPGLDKENIGSDWK